MQAPRLSFFALQHFRSLAPFFSPFLRSSVRKTLPGFPKVPYTGFGYPLYGFSNQKPWEPLSAPNAQGLRPTELCSFQVATQLFRAACSIPALFYKTSRPSNGASTYLPPGKPHPLLLPRVLPRVGTTCSPGHSDLLGFLFLESTSQRSMLRHAPHVLRSCKPYSSHFHEPQGILTSKPWRFPWWDASPSGLFTGCRSQPFRS
jgi:hypothetical protein